MYFFLSMISTLYVSWNFFSSVMFFVYVDDYTGVDAAGVEILPGDPVRLNTNSEELSNLNHTQSTADIGLHAGHVGLLKYFDANCHAVVYVAGTPWTVQTAALTKVFHGKELKSIKLFRLPDKMRVLIPKNGRLTAHSWIRRNNWDNFFEGPSALIRKSLITVSAGNIFYVICHVSMLLPQITSTIWR